MDEAISSVLLTIGSIIAVSVLIAAVYPAVQRLSGTSSSMTTEIRTRMATAMDIIHTAKNGDYSVTVWIKNIGKESIGYDLLEKSDVFFGPKGNFTRLSSGSWSFIIENDAGEGNWDPRETLRIDITPGYNITSGRYHVKFVLFNGVWTEDYFSVE